MTPTSSESDDTRPGSAVYQGAVVHGGGRINVGGDAVGYQVNRGERQRDRQPRPSARSSVDVGILTVLAEESDAVVEVLRRHRSYYSEQLYGGMQVHSAYVSAEGGELRVVAVQTLDRGPLSAAVAYGRMRDLFRPTVVLLVGIAGGIGAGLAIGDVVIADEVIYYDARRETGDGHRRRGRSLPTAPVLRHRVNELFRRCGGSVAAPPNDDIQLHRGPIGSGDAVVTDSSSDIITFLRAFNEKTLAVETEAGGVGQAFYERIDQESSLTGWLTVRGISDLADRHKSDRWHQFAARRAALVMDRLLPLLKLAEPPR